MTESESNASTSSTTSQADNRRVLGAGALLAEGGSSISITTLDGDVASAAFKSNTAVSKAALDTGADLAKAALNAGTQGEKLAFSFAAKSQSQVLDSLASQGELIKDSYADAKGRGALTDKILIGSIAMAGLVAIAALKR